MSEDDTRFSLDTGLNDIGFAKVWLKPVPFLDKPSWTIRKRQEHKEKVGELITTIKLDLDHKGREMFRAAKNCYDYLLRSYKGVELSSWMHAFWEAIEHIHVAALQANITNEMLPNIEKQAASPIFTAAITRNNEVNSEYAGYNDFCKLLLADKTTPSQHGWTLQRRCEFLDCALAVTKVIRSHMTNATNVTTYGKAAQLTLESLYQNDASHDDVTAFWYATILIHGEALERGRHLAVMPTLIANELVLVFQMVIKKLKAQKSILQEEQSKDEDEPMKTDELQLNIRKPVGSLELMTTHDRALCVRAAALTVQFVSETLQKGGTLDNAANVALKVVLNELTDKLELQVLGSEELRKLTVSQKSEIEAIENGFWLAIEDLRQRCSFEKIEHLKPEALDAVMADWKGCTEELVTKYIGTLSDAEDEQRAEAADVPKPVAYSVEADLQNELIEKHHLMEAFDKALAARPAKIRVDFDIRTLEVEF